MFLPSFLMLEISCAAFYIIFTIYEDVPLSRAARATSGTRVADYSLRPYSVE
jgi:hypothetical protein